MTTPLPLASENLLRVAQIVPVTEAEGPGVRFALWFQGCPLRCAGCCNPEMLPFEGGTLMPLGEVVAQIEEAARVHDVEGITLLGGEPLAHATEALALAQEVHRLGLTVMIFSGYLIEDARAMPDPAINALIGETDILVDGPYDRDQPETQRRWIGSKNQRIHFLTGRCDADDPLWLLPNTLEIRLQDGELAVNGFPARNAVGLWKRPRRVKSE